MSGYQVFLLLVLVLWPLAIGAGLLLMERMEKYVERSDAGSPREAGLDPVTGASPEKEVQIVFGDTVIGERH